MFFMIWFKLNLWIMMICLLKRLKNDRLVVWYIWNLYVLRLLVSDGLVGLDNIGLYVLVKVGLFWVVGLWLVMMLC